MSPRQRPPSLRSRAFVLIESSTISSPFEDDDHVVDRCAWLAEEVSKWLPDAPTVVCFPPDDALSLWARGVQQRLAYVGVQTMTRAEIAVARARTRMLYHARSNHEQGNLHSPDIAADRWHHFNVSLGDVAPFETIAAVVAEYAALLAFPVTPEELHPPVVPDEEPF